MKKKVCLFGDGGDCAEGASKLRLSKESKLAPASTIGSVPLRPMIFTFWPFGKSRLGNYVEHFVAELALLPGRNSETASIKLSYFPKNQLESFGLLHITDEKESRVRQKRRWKAVTCRRH